MLRDDSDMFAETLLSEDEGDVQADDSSADD